MSHFLPNTASKHSYLRKMAAHLMGILTTLTVFFIPQTSYAAFPGKVAYASSGVQFSSAQTACQDVLQKERVGFGFPLTFQRVEAYTPGDPLTDYTCWATHSNPAASNPYPFFGYAKASSQCSANADPSISGGGVICNCQFGFVERNNSCVPVGEETTTILVNKNAGGGSSCNLIGNPINPSTGSKYLLETDYVSGALPLELRFERSYNSQYDNLAGNLDLGAGWRHSYSRSLIFDFTDPDLQIQVLRQDGRSVNFTFTAGGFVADPDVSDKLDAITGAGGVTTGYVFTEAETYNTETYNTDGQLISIRSRAGWNQTLSYSDLSTLPAIASAPGLLIAITDQGGRALQLQYDNLNHLVALIDPTGQIYAYRYDFSENLIEVTYPNATTRTYLYNEIALTGGADLPHALTGIIDENGARFASYEYAITGKAIRTEHAGGAMKFTVAYNADGSSTVIDPIGASRTYNFSVVQNVSVPAGVSQPCASCGGSSSNSTYDANGNLASKTDFNGNLTTYVYDLTRNLETSRTEAAGTPLARTITTAWHPTFRLPTQITEPNRVTTFVYDTQGNVAQQTITSGTLIRAWTYTYNSFGQALTVDGPRTDVADVSTYTYDTQANLATVTNALGHITRLTAYDAHGRPLTIQDPNGLVTQLGYDVRGRLISRFVGSELTQFQYDGVGQLTRIILPDSSFMDYTYDAAHRPVGMTDALGNKITYTLDALDNRLKEEIFNPSNVPTQQRRRVFDSLSRLAQDVGAYNQVTSYQYDANGNLLNRTDPLLHTTTQAYDALNRLVQITDPAAGVSRYTFDSNDRLTQVIDPRGIGTAYNYDGLDNLTQTLSLDTGTTTNTYDTAGNLATQTNAQGQQSIHTYDALNRLTKTLFADATSVTYQYDIGINALGRLTKMTDPAAVTQWSYNAQGRATTKTQTTGSITRTLSYAYEANGRIAQITYPSGKIISYGYDLAGNLAQLSVNGQSLLTAILYQPYGAANEWTWGNGSRHSRTFNQDGRMVSHPLGTLSYDAAGRVVQQAQGAVVQSYAYDVVDRLTQHVDPANLVTTYQYDISGNRTRLNYGATTYNYNYSVTSHRLLNATGIAAMGNLARSGATQLSYNAAGRLRSATWNNGTPWSFTYNGFGQRVSKDTTLTKRYYGYDEQGHLIGEYDKITGQAIQETVYLGDVPVAVLQGTGVYYVYTDHLGTPRAITNTLNQTIWRWNSDPFGTTLANEDPDGDSTKFTYNLRFAGQYFDEETGLHYNMARDYDPSTGRYIQSDPIGLAGGLNTYAYVDSNPLSFTDPLGLAKCEGVKPANMSPPGAGRSGAFNEAKRQSGIPTSQQPSRVLSNVDKRGDLQPGRTYEYEVPASGGKTKTVSIRDDAGGHDFGRGNSQNRGSHFNDEAKNHYDY